MTDASGSTVPEPMEVDPPQQAQQAPTVQRVTSTPKKRGAPSAGSASKRSSPRTPPRPRPSESEIANAAAEAAPQPPSWTEQEHDQLVDAVWQFGLQSVAAVDGGSIPQLGLSPSALSCVATTLVHKTTDQLSAYVRALVWDIYAALSFAAPLLPPLGSSFHLDGPFLERLVRVHGLGRAGTESDLVTPLAPDTVREWAARLRRQFVLAEMLRPTTGAEADLQQALSAAAKYDETSRHLFPRDQWTSKDDEALMRDALTHGYGCVAPAIAGVGANSPAMYEERLDFILDELQRSACTEPKSSSTTSSAAATAGVSSPPVANLFTVPAHSQRVLSTPLLIQLADVLTTYGLPMLPFVPAAPEVTAEQVAESKVSPVATPSPPFIDWAVLSSLLARHLPGSFPEAPEALAALLTSFLAHVAADYEQLAHSCFGGRVGLGTGGDFVRGSCERFGLPVTVDASHGLLPATQALALRRAFLFWHHLRVRVLDLAFHEFTQASQLLEWVSQFAPGLLESKVVTQPQGLGSALGAASTRTPSGALLQGTLSMHAPSATGAANAAHMPAWWQIGLHDLCLLQVVSNVGLEPATILAAVNDAIAKCKNLPAEAVTAEASAEPVAVAAESVHWAANRLWLAHSRPIIRQRMGVGESDSIAADEVLPPPESLTDDHLPAVLKRLAQLVPALAAVATDELMNRLLQSVEIAPTPAVDEVAPSSLTPPAFILSPSAAKSLRHFTGTFPGYTCQSELFGLLKTRFHELRPGSHKVRSAGSSQVGWRKHQSGGGAILLAAGSDPPENPLKVADSAFLRPSLFGLAANSECLLQSVAPQSYSAIGGRPLLDDTDGDERMGVREEAALEQDGGLESELMAEIEARRRRTVLGQRIRALYEEPTAAALEQPVKIVLREDGQLALPQQLADGFVLHTLGVLTTEHLHYARRPVSVVSVKTEDDTAAVASPVLVLYPVGFRSIVTHQSYKRADTLASYQCEVLRREVDPSSLVFRVQASDDLASAPIVAASPQEAWEEVVSRVLLVELDAPVLQRRDAMAIDGLERFGLTKPAVLHALALQLQLAEDQLPAHLATLLPPATIQAHLAALPPAQFYQLDTLSVEEDTAVRRALEQTWSHHLLRFRELTRGLLPDDIPSPSVAASTTAATHAAQAHALAAQEEVEREARAAQATAAAVQAAQAAHAAAVSAASAAAAGPTMYAAPGHHPAYFPSHYGMTAHPHAHHPQFAVAATHAPWGMEQQQQMYMAQQQQMQQQMQAAYMQQQHAAQAAQAQAQQPYLHATMIANAAAAVNAQT